MFEIDPYKEQELIDISNAIGAGHFPKFNDKWNIVIWDKLGYLLSLIKYDKERYISLRRYFYILKDYLQVNDLQLKQYMKNYTRNYKRKYNLDPEHLKNKQESGKKTRQRPEYKEKQKVYDKEHSQIPEVKQKRKIYKKEYDQKPEAIQKRREQDRARNHRYHTLEYKEWAKNYRAKKKLERENKVLTIN